MQRQINPKLKIEGILLTVVDNRTNYAREISAMLRESYGSKVRVFATDVPHSVRAAEISAEGKSIYEEKQVNVKRCPDALLQRDFDDRL